jgi:hypothetical protein
MSIFKNYLKQISEAYDPSAEVELDNKHLEIKFNKAAELILELANSIDTEDSLNQLDVIFEDLRAKITFMIRSQNKQYGA